MSYALQKIASLIGAHVWGTSEASIDWLLTDSRSVSAYPESTLFFALRSPRNDGHKYIPDLYRRGVRSFVVSQLPGAAAEDYPDACFLQVESPLAALQQLAKACRETFDGPVVGVTGSNGKTVVKEWLYQLLASSRCVTRSPRSYNSQIGVPLSVWLLQEGHTDMAVFEAGISQPGEMVRLRSMIQPTIGVMTNLGSAHQENFTSETEKCLEKLSLFQDCKVVVYDADDPVVAECAGQSLLRSDHLAWSRRDMGRPLFIRDVRRNADHTTVSYTYLGTDGAYTLPFTDDASVQNSIHCLAVCLYLRLPADEIARGMARLEPVAMRLEVKQGVRGCTLINDSYNSDVNSLDIALDFMNRRPDSRPRTLILSDILESGQPADALYAKVAGMVNGRGINHLIGVGPDISGQAAQFAVAQKSFFANSEALLASGVLDELHDEVILLKGARKFNFEALGERLSLKVHETTLEVNLAALVRNLNYYRSFMKPETKMVCMVKASAYGAGAVEIAKTLQDHRVDYLAVAVADEGADLRKAGITGNVIIMNPEMSTFGKLFQYNLEPEVYSFGLLEALIKAAEKEGVTHFPIHLKFDTGMHRLGFDPEHDLPALISRLHRQTALLPRSVFSHFAGADGEEFDSFSQTQFDLFDKASRRLQEAFPYKILRHICNSAGIERFPERHLDMVRLGLGLYGIDPFCNRLLSNVTTLKTTILQIRNVPRTDTVGYSRRGVLRRDSRIAAIPIGYADGLNRHLGCGHGYCLVNGQKAPYVGNICMDVCMIDVTDIDCKEGDTVEIFGDHLPVTVLSDALDTIPYEVLTSVSERVKRVYFQE